MDIFKVNLTLSQWTDLFILAMAMIVVCSFGIMVSTWVILAKLNDIKDHLSKSNQQDDTEY